MPGYIDYNVNICGIREENIFRRLVTWSDAFGRIPVLTIFATYKTSTKHVSTIFATYWRRQLNADILHVLHVVSVLCIVSEVYH